jgi:RHS repeat-associated protein
MKKYIHLLTLIISIIYSGVFAQTITPSTDKNAVVHSQLRVATTSESDANNPTKAVITINYADGLGRSLQTVGYQQSPTQKDIITSATSYDKYGRPTLSVLPVPATSGTGAYQNNALGLGQSFYADSRPYSSVSLENSILSREREIMGAGQAWQTNNKKTQVFDETAGSDIRLYKLDGSNNIVLNGAYPSNSLFKKRIIDEQGHTSITVQDKQGRLIQKQQQDATGYITTYYIYDGLNRLKAVIQPEGYELNASINYNSTEWQRWVFFYLYDYRGRLIEKKTPGAEAEYMVYDKWDRLVWQQNAQQREKGLWTFKKYDALNRLVMSGEKSENRNRVDLQAETSAWGGGRYESRIVGGVSYSLTNSYPTLGGTSEIRELYHYDDYGSWLSGDMDFDRANAYHDQHPTFVGMATGGKVRNTESNNLMTYTNYYDNKRRIIQTFAINVYGRIERTDFQYNFAGDVLEIKSLLRDENNVANVQVERFEYDNVGSRTVFKVAMGAAPTETVCSYEYNEIRQQKTKKYFPNQTFTVGGSKDYIIRPSVDGIVTQSNTHDLARKYVILEPTSEIKAINLNTYRAEIDPNAPQGQTIQGLQTMNFKHHIRGGLLGINLDNANNPTPTANEGDLFAFKLDYESAGFYDGNIGKQTWQNINLTNNTPLGVRSFIYTYTPNSALKSATYTGIGAENFSMPNLSYDKNGNITNLQRNGKQGESFGTIDNLSYNYSGNRLVGVTDAINGNEDVGDFRDNGSNTDYTYWNDGSLKSDANKGISLIEYDTYLQKVKQVTFSNSNWVKFFYGIGGMLIKRTNSFGDIWAYTPKAIYKNGVLYQISQSEGRILYVANVWVYEFEYRDHQNNLRVAFKADGNQLVQTQTNETDPFGLEIKPLSVQNGINSNQYKFLNRQDIPELNGVSDLINRFYDKQNGRFWSTDPQVDEGQHSFTPYHYSFNNPIRFSDPDGLMACCGGDPDGLGNGMTLVENIYWSTRDVLASSIATIGTAFASVFSDVKPQRINTTYSSGKRTLSAEIIPKGEVAGEVAMSTFVLATAVPSGGNAGTSMLMAKAGTKTTAASSVANAVKKYEVGEFDDLIKRSQSGDGLQIHHAPQKQPAGQIINNYDKKTGPSIALPDAEHRAIPNMKGTTTAGTPRQQLATDIRNLRNYTNTPNSSLTDLIGLTKAKFPIPFKKP